MEHVKAALLGSLITVLALLNSGAVLAQNIETVAGNGSTEYTGDGGQATAAGLTFPTSVLPTRDGGFYVSTDVNVRKVSAAGVINTVAGQCCRGDNTGDWGPATEAHLSGVTAMASDAAGNLYLTQTRDHRVRRIDTSGIINNYAGDGRDGYTAQAGPATLRHLTKPAALALASDGTLFIADRTSIRKVRTDGIMETVAGTGTIGYNGDNIPAITAQLNMPEGLAVGPDGSVYIADTGNRRLRRIGPDGIITTLAEDVYPNQLVRDPQGNLYFPTLHTSQVHRYNTQGQIELVAGDGNRSYSGDGGPALTAQLNIPTGVGIDAQGRLYIADQANRRIRRIGASVTQGLQFIEATVTEGNAGTIPAVFKVTLPAPAATPVVYDVATRDGTAQTPGDYLGLAERRIIPAGQSQDSFTVHVNGDTSDEPNEAFFVDITVVNGAVIAGGGSRTTLTGMIEDDDAATPPLSLFMARDDRQVLAENSPLQLIDALDNDEIADARFSSGSLAVVSAPMHGTAKVVPRGMAGYVGDDLFSYMPAADWTGEDRFRYRLCENSGRCVEADVVVVVRPLVDLVMAVGANAGNIPLEIENLRALPSARFAATPLVRPTRIKLETLPDPTIAQPWDGTAGIDWQVRSLAVPADGRPRDWRILIRYIRGQVPGTVFVGLDLDGNGAPSADELRCTADETSGYCDMGVSQSGSQGVAYWVAAQNRQVFSYSFDVDIFEIPMTPGDGSLTMTGPGRLAAREAFTGILAWNDATFVYGQTRAGFVQVRSGATTSIGEFPVIISEGGSFNHPMVLTSGIPKTVRMCSSSCHERTFIDVPAGASQLTVTTTSEGDANFYLARRPGDETPERPDIDLAPSRANAIAVAKGPSGNETVVIQGAQLQPGRWYVVLEAARYDEIEVTVTATVTGASPLVRSGSYYNPARVGHGLFLYPAGGSLAGIWYTYRQNLRGPTWYYLQAVKPGPNGIWSAKVYRGAWDGSASHLTEVGKAEVTPTGADAFVFTYTIDGITGSEPMSALGRGCPSRGGTVVDMSSHWFDPAHAGTGYSVQMFPNYEFYAAFVYDGRGEPRFLLAEKSGFGADDVVLDLQQLSVNCPECIEGGPPKRVTVGTLRRRLSADGLASIELDAIYVPDFNARITGAWSSVDVLQLLGGAETTQGCDP